MVSKTSIKVETMITIWVEIASSPNLKATCTVVATKDNSTPMLPSYHHKTRCHSNPIKTMVKIHTDKITIVDRMSCLAPRAHSTAKTVAIKVETCKIVKVQTKEDSETLLVALNGSPRRRGTSQRIHTSHHKQHHWWYLNKMDFRIRMLIQTLRRRAHLQDLRVRALTLQR